MELNTVKKQNNYQICAICFCCLYFLLTIRSSLSSGIMGFFMVPQRFATVGALLIVMLSMFIINLHKQMIVISTLILGLCDMASGIIWCYTSASMPMYLKAMLIVKGALIIVFGMIAISQKISIWVKTVAGLIPSALTIAIQVLLRNVLTKMLNKHSVSYEMRKSFLNGTNLQDRYAWLVILTAVLAVIYVSGEHLDIIKRVRSVKWSYSLIFFADIVAFVSLILVEPIEDVMLAFKYSSESPIEFSDFSDMPFEYLGVLLFSFFMWRFIEKNRAQNTLKPSHFRLYPLYLLAYQTLCGIYFMRYFDGYGEGFEYIMICLVYAGAFIPGVAVGIILTLQCNNNIYTSAKLNSVHTMACVLTIGIGICTMICFDTLGYGSDSYGRAGLLTLLMIASFAIKLICFIKSFNNLIKYNGDKPTNI